MGKASKIEIKSDGTGLTQIYIDGHKINGVRSYKLEQYATDTPIFTVDLNALDVSVENGCILRHKGFLEEMEIKFKDVGEIHSCQ